jgi:hypothetical protein
MKRFLAMNLGNDNNPNYQFIKEIEESSYIEIKNQINIVNEADDSIDLFLIHKNNFGETVDFHNEHFRDFIENMTEPIKTDKNEYTFIKIEINRILLNYLSSFRMLIDHSERLIKKRFGKDSTEFLTLKETLKNAYDNHFEYRFIYKLRNFCQHCGIPVTDFIIDNTKKSAEMCFNKQYLLNEYDSWGVEIKNDFLKLEPKFSVNEILLKNIEIMNNISKMIHSLYKGIFIDSLRRLHLITQKHRGKHELIILTELDTNDETHNITIQRFPFEKIDLFINGIS